MILSGENEKSALKNALLITGISGAGKTTALKNLEDFGFFCVDNIPPQLLEPFIELAQRVRTYRIAIVLDIRSKEFLDFNTYTLADYVKKLKNLGLKVIFLTARDEVVIRRFKATRRSHPLTGDDILKGITLEKRLMANLAELADYTIDTSNTSPWELRVKLQDIISQHPKFKVRLISFSYRNGIPLDAELVLDLRFLKNPHYVPELADLPGTSEEVQRYIQSDELYNTFIENTLKMLDILIKGFSRQGKSSLTIAFGCTGGKHRSVGVVENIAKILRGKSLSVEVTHRDLS